MDDPAEGIREGFIFGSEAGAERQRFEDSVAGISFTVPTLSPSWNILIGRG